MKKFLLLFLGFILATLTFSSCKKEEEGPGYYFRFKANGVAYDYEYECIQTLFGSGCSFGAGPTGNSVTVSNYQIYAYHPNPSASGEVFFALNKSDFATMDTIILDGIRNRASTYKLDYADRKGDGNSLRPPLLGKLIILERGADFLKGEFEFDAYRKEMDSTGFSMVTDSVIHFTSGSFYVPADFE